MYLLILFCRHVLLLLTAYFTSHYVSINSNPISKLTIQVNTLHPTMYLLILKTRWSTFPVMITLHPTMYLLIPFSSTSNALVIIAFTSHYVSINSRPLQAWMELVLTLHPTMYLLIPYPYTCITPFWRNFTSHYVSINSHNCCSAHHRLGTLHPTMYLLIPIIMVRLC